MSDSNESKSSPFGNLSSGAMLGIGGAVVVVVLLLVLTFTVFIPQSVKSNGNKKEAALSATYIDGANYLSNCVIKSEQAAGVASANAQAFDQVIKDAVAGTAAGGQHVDLGSAAGRSSFLPILVQAYPDLKGQTDLFNKVVDVVTGCQDDYRNKQSTVQDQVRDFNSWRSGSFWTRMYGGSFPNNNLYVTLPNQQPVHAQAALDKISTPIVEGSTAGSYSTGIQQVPNLFPTPTASATK